MEEDKIYQEALAAAFQYVEEQQIKLFLLNCVDEKTASVMLGYAPDNLSVQYRNKTTVIPFRWRRQRRFYDLRDIARAWSGK